MSKAEGARRSALVRRSCSVCEQPIRPSSLARHEAKHALPWDKVNKTEGCWVWTGTVSEYGYPVTSHADEQYAHRLFYQAAGNAIPVGWQVDHLCLNKRCVRPDHLEAVTQAENVRRASRYAVNHNRIKTHCAKGHPYTPENTIHRATGGRRCRKCMTARYGRSQAVPA